ncbi:MAG: NAD(P)-dependent oxidoreductase [Chloroflexi bacterium]|nr:NAD(P)-dependent oxidoreductase [Chloroflexota bacterium]
MRIAVTGAGGRLGGAILRVIAAGSVSPAVAAVEALPWGRAELDLDAPDSVGEHLDASQPDLVIHAAAWTDVDACALDPELAVRRNGAATGVLAAAAAGRGVDLIAISTNEVFDGSAPGRPYQPADPPSPANPYGASKLAGERFAAEAYGGAPGARGTLGIVRTAWLFGPGRPDFPTKIGLAARRAIQAGEPLRLVIDEIGTPTFVDDVAAAILDLALDGSFGGIHHVVNGGTASRAEWGRDILRRLELPVDVVEVSLADFARPSRPPRWGVLAPTPLPGGRVLRPWSEAMAAYLPALRESVTMAS